MSGVGETYFCLNSIVFYSHSDQQLIWLWQPSIFEKNIVCKTLYDFDNFAYMKFVESGRYQLGNSVLLCGSSLAHDPSGGPQPMSNSGFADASAFNEHPLARLTQTSTKLV